MAYVVCVTILQLHPLLAPVCPPTSFILPAGFVPKYLHQEAESKQNMLNKIQVNLLQKHYSKRACSK